MDWKVYIVKCSDKTFYTGITNNIKLRLETHNLGKGAKYTKSRLPVILVYLEPVDDKSSALRREIEIKKLNRSQKINLINSTDLSAT
jgi:putative endonuclease|tara:strand:+ start:219 stop:479 length:261 start_codon:yes stop_codon:yes gene_type:complete